MIIWYVLFFIILLLSFILAFFSMKDYQEIPSQGREYSVYLIRKPQFLSVQILNTLLDLSKGKVIALERLFKGKNSALVIFGPRNILENRFSELLGLLELEDYTRVVGEVASWELGKRGDITGNIFESLPAFAEFEQFWWQVTLSGSSSGSFGQLRAIFVAESKERLNDLTNIFESLNDNFVKIPRPFSSREMLEFYRQRSLTRANTFTLSADETLRIIGLLHK